MCFPRAALAQAIRVNADFRVVFGEDAVSMAEDIAQRIPGFIEPFRVAPGSSVNLARDFDPGFKSGVEHKRDGEDLLRTGIELLAKYQERLAAQDTYGVLVVLQALDAAGKDGTIRHVMSGVNPQGVRVESFKVPSERELDQDFLRRYQERLAAQDTYGVLVVLQALDAAGKDGTIRHVMSGLNPQGVRVESFKVPSERELNQDFLRRYQKRLPSRGEIGIFNRSHYEEVLVVRVHPENLLREKLPAATREHHVWTRRYEAINGWEQYLSENGFRIVKLFLNLSREEQRVRFLRRIDLPDHNWKFSSHDVQERQSWDAYQEAFSEMFSHTSTPWAPWYVIPADRKWFARTAAAAVIAQALIDIDPQYPRLGDQALHDLETAKLQLEAEAPGGAAADPFEAAATPGKQAG